MAHFFKKTEGRIFNYDNRGRWFRSIENGMTMMCYESVTMVLMWLCYWFDYDVCVDHKMGATHVTILIVNHTFDRKVCKK